MPHTTQRRRRRMGAASVWWVALAIIFVAGIGLWLFGVTWGAALPAIALIGFVVRSWLDTAPQGGHVHDTGLVGYLPEPPRITPDQP